MNIYRRYFRITEGPVIDYIKEAIGINDAAHEQYKAILEELGAEQEYYHRGRRMTGLIFKNEPDRSIFKKRKPGGWWPKKTTKVGKELLARIEAIKTKDPDGALKIIGRRGEFEIWGGGKAYHSTLVFIPEESITVYINIPWYDEDPEKIEKYKAEREAGKRGDGNLDSLIWSPTPEMEEIKGWEVDKHIDQYNESRKAA